MDYLIPLADEDGNVIGLADRWSTHTVRQTDGGLVLGQRHVGICIACQDGSGRVLLQFRRHKIFDRCWSFTADTHPRKYEGRELETLFQAATRCANEDFGIVVEGWVDALTVTYAARDPRDPRFCENEFMHLLVGRHDGEVRPNPESVYACRWADPEAVMNEVASEAEVEPEARRYAPWVHSVFNKLSKENRIWVL